MVSQSVSISGVGGQNNTMITCQAEQRGQDGHLIYNSSLAVITLKMTSKLMLKHLDIWSSWEIIIFVLLVVAAFLLLTCCGMYCFFAKWRKPQKVIKSNSAETQTSHQQSITCVTIPEPVSTKKEKSEAQVTQMQMQSELSSERETNITRISSMDTRIRGEYADR